MTRSQRLIELEPDSTLQFLDPQWDRFLLGVAYRSRTPVLPVYGYNAIKTYLNQTVSKAESFKIIGSLMNNNLLPAPLLLRSFLAKDLHDEIKAKSLLVWDDTITTALLGVCYRHGFKSATAYSYDKTVDLLQHSQVGSESTNSLLDATEFLEKRLIPVWLGETSPYFIRTID